MTSLSRLSVRAFNNDISLVMFTYMIHSNNMFEISTYDVLLDLWYHMRSFFGLQILVRVSHACEFTPQLSHVRLALCDVVISLGERNRRQNIEFSQNKTKAGLETLDVDRNVGEAQQRTNHDRVRRWQSCLGRRHLNSCYGRLRKERHLTQSARVKARRYI